MQSEKTFWGRGKRRNKRVREPKSNSFNRVGLKMMENQGGKRRNRGSGSLNLTVLIGWG